MTNGSAGNTVSNNDARSTGDDSFALFNAVDGGGGEVGDNVFENLSATLTWRAAGFAVYGGTNNVFRNLYVADMLVYSGITISSLDFGIRLNDVDIVDPTYSGIMFQTDDVSGQRLFPIADTVLTNISISGARRSGDAFDAKSGFGIWAKELPEPGEGPAAGTATFNNLTLTDNAVDIRNTTTTFTIVRN